MPLEKGVPLKEGVPLEKGVIPGGNDATQVFGLGEREQNKNRAFGPGNLIGIQGIVDQGTPSGQVPKCPMQGLMPLKGKTPSSCFIVALVIIVSPS